MPTFEEAQAHIKTFPGTLDNNTLLKLYALFKQGTIGDCNTKQPSRLYFKEKAKWDAWKQETSKSSEDAQKEYIELVYKLHPLA